MAEGNTKPAIIAASAAVVAAVVSSMTAVWSTMRVEEIAEDQQLRDAPVVQVFLDRGRPDLRTANVRVLMANDGNSTARGCTLTWVELANPIGEEDGAASPQDDAEWIVGEENDVADARSVDIEPSGLETREFLYQPSEDEAFDQNRVGDLRRVEVTPECKTPDTRAEGDALTLRINESAEITEWLD